MKDTPFTVKWILEDGSVFLYPASQVRGRVAKDAPAYQAIVPTIDIVEFDRGDGSDVWGSIDSGVVYVMNQNGKTVDTYYLPSKTGPELAA